jgi:hypothetical protein
MPDSPAGIPGFRKLPAAWLARKTLNAPELFAHEPGGEDLTNSRAAGDGT